MAFPARFMGVPSSRHHPCMRSQHRHHYLKSASCEAQRSKNRKHDAMMHTAHAAATGVAAGAGVLDTGVWDTKHIWHWIRRKESFQRVKGTARVLVHYTYANNCGWLTCSLDSESTLTFQYSCALGCEIL